jgi:hypothetical protein
VQLVRTRGALARANDLSRKLKAIAQELGAPEDYFKPPPEVGPDENALKAFFASRICSANTDLGPALLEKDWLLMQSESKDPFLLGDHPVVVDNYLGGKFGLGTSGAVIYFPLSPEFALGLHCPSIAKEITSAHERLVSLPDEVLACHPELYAGFEATTGALEGFYKGIPIKQQSENVENFNSLQVIEAERFVFSCNDNSELVKDMLRTNPELKNGPPLSVKRGL